MSSKLIAGILKSISSESVPKMISIQIRKNMGELSKKLYTNSVSVNIYLSEHGDLCARVYYISDGKSLFLDMDFFDACFGVKSTDIDAACKIFTGINSALEKTIGIIKEIVGMDERMFLLYVSGGQLVLMLKSSEPEKTQKFDFQKRLEEIMSENPIDFGLEAERQLGGESEE